MFYNNLFVKNFNNKNIKFLSVKQLYILYKLFNNLNLGIFQNKPNLYYSYLYLALYNFNLNYNYLFLVFLYFVKTKNVVSIKVLENSNHSLFNSSDVLSSGNVNSLNSFNLFWRKWKNLKRPSTNSDVFNYYLDDFKKKLNVYTKLGFVSVYNTYVVVKYKFTTFTNTVSFDKSLLSSPKYSSSTVHKYLSTSDLNNFEFQFLRKNKVYNKGRYSRTRQNYRTGVYLCMYLSVMSLFGLYYWFYKFSFNFTYLWWFFIAFVASFFVPKIVKYRLYEPSTLVSKVYEFFKWFNLLVKSLFF